MKKKLNIITIIIIVLSLNGLLKFKNSFKLFLRKPIFEINISEMNI